MKRSKMMYVLDSALYEWNELTLNDETYPIRWADFVLQKLEDAGMLPPTVTFYDETPDCNLASEERTPRYRRYSV